MNKKDRRITLAKWNCVCCTRSTTFHSAKLDITRNRTSSMSHIQRQTIALENPALKPLQRLVLHLTQATSPMPLVPWCGTSGAPAANTNPVNTTHGRTIHNGTLLKNFILGHGTGFQDFSVTGNKLVTGSYTFFRALWVFGVALGGCVTRLRTQLPTLPLCILYMYT